MLTLEEQERAAYIRGDVALATVLGAALDAENDALAQENARLREEVRELEDMIDEARDSHG